MRECGACGRLVPDGGSIHCGLDHLPELSKGDYVLATKYSDGDPGDQWCVGFYDGWYDHYGQTRHLVVDSAGRSFRGNGFRRCERITDAEGRFLIDHLAEIEAAPMWVEEIDGEGKMCGESLWDWLAKSPPPQEAKP